MCCDGSKPSRYHGEIVGIASADYRQCTIYRAAIAILQTHDYTLHAHTHVIRQICLGSNARMKQSRRLLFTSPVCICRN